MGKGDKGDRRKGHKDLLCGWGLPLPMAKSNSTSVTMEVQRLIDDLYEAGESEIIEEVAEYTAVYVNRLQGMRGGKGKGKDKGRGKGRGKGKDKAVPKIQ